MGPVGIPELLWLVLGGAAGLLMWGAQVQPEQAVSNIAGWARALLGLRKLPEWLETTEADRVVRHIAGILLTIWMVIGIVLLVDTGKIHVGPKGLFAAGCLAIIASIIWHLIAGPSVAPAPAKPGGAAESKSDPIAWAWGFVIGARQLENGIEIYQFQATGQNNTKKFISRIGGFVRSEITGETFPIRLQHNGGYVDTVGYGIPAQHQFHIAAPFVESGGISPARFLRDFGRLTFQFEYDGEIFTRYFSAEELAAEVRRTEEFLRPQLAPTTAGLRQIATPYDKPLIWAAQYISSTTEFSGDLADALDKIRQAARSGSLAIWGRPNSNHLSVGQFFKPLERIDERHWCDFGFDTLRCLFHDDARECRTKPDDTKSMRYDEVFVDLRVNEAQVRATWKPS